MVMQFTMDIFESVLRDEWETARILKARLGDWGPQTRGVTEALGGLVAKRRALRREVPPGSCRYEYRRP